jgi:hypothetical protein
VGHVRGRRVARARVLEWLDNHRTLDDTDSRSRFKFGKGEQVIAKRGKGRIRQGYDTGEVRLYEVEGENGVLFMASEEDLRLKSPAKTLSVGIYRLLKLEVRSRVLNRAPSRWNASIFLACNPIAEC